MGLPYVEDATKLIAREEIGGDQFQLIKVVHGDPGVNDGPASTANPFPVKSPDGAVVTLGATTDASAAADNSNVGLVALFKRLLARITTLIGAVSTAAKQDTGNVSLASIDTKLSGALNVTGSVVGITGNVEVMNDVGNPLPISAAALPLPAGASTEATLLLIKAKTDNIDTASSLLAKAAQQTDGTQKAIARGGAKGTTTAADITSTASGANHNGADVVLYDAAGNVIDPRVIRAIASGTDNITVVQGTAAALAGAWPMKPTDGTTAITIKAASTAAIATDTSEVIQLSPNQPQLTTPLNVRGSQTNNNAAPGATNFGILDALANAGVPAWTEGNQVMKSVDLGGGQRVVSRPMVILGAYRLAAQTAVYAGLIAGAILYSFRWTDATKICRVTRVRVAVNTITAAGAAGMLDRDLVIVRGFTVADSGGTAITLTGNNQKARTSHATTVVGGIQILSGGALTAGTGTADAQAIGLVTKQGLAAEPPGLTIPPEDLFAYNVGQNYPIVLAANEGFRVRIPTAMPTTIAQRTTVTVEWDEIATATAF